MQESKENQPERFGENQTNDVGDDAPLARREIETWGREDASRSTGESSTSGTSSWKCSVNLMRWRERSRR